MALVLINKEYCYKCTILKNLWTERVKSIANITTNILSKSMPIIFLYYFAGFLLLLTSMDVLVHHNELLNTINQTTSTDKIIRIKLDHNFWSPSDEIIYADTMMFVSSDVSWALTVIAFKSAFIFTHIIIQVKLEPNIYNIQCL